MLRNFNKKRENGLEVHYFFDEFFFCSSIFIITTLHIQTHIHSIYIYIHMTYLVVNADLCYLRFDSGFA